jgi:hypothetical protein
MRKYKWLLILVALLIFLLSANPMAIPSRKIDWFSIGSSAVSLKTGKIQLDSLVGQPVVGKVEAGKIELGSGYLFYAEKTAWVFFLPWFAK